MTIHREKQVVLWVHRDYWTRAVVEEIPSRQYVYTRADGTQYAISYGDKVPVTRRGEAYLAEMGTGTVHLLQAPVYVQGRLVKEWRVACSPTRHYTDFVRSQNRAEVTCGNCLRRK